MSARRVVRALLVSRIANLERDLRLECAAFLRQQGAPSVADGDFELELTTWVPPATSSPVTREDDDNLVRLMREAEVVIADPILFGRHLHRILPRRQRTSVGSRAATTNVEMDGDAGQLQWVQSTWAGVDSIARALAAHSDLGVLRWWLMNARAHLSLCLLTSLCRRSLHSG